MAKNPVRWLQERRAERPMFADRGSWYRSCLSRIAARFRLVRWVMPSAPVRMRLRELDDEIYCRLGSTDIPVLNELFKSGAYDHVIANLPSAPDVVVDLGCNIGLTVRLWRHHWPDCTVLGIEADPENMAVCETNTRCLSPPPRLITGFVDSVEGRVFLDRSGGEWGVTESNSRTDVEVPRISMATVLEDLGRDIDLLKCDIEGAEMSLFKNCHSWINRVRAMIIETHAPYTSSELIDDLRAAGWSHPVDIISRYQDNCVVWSAPDRTSH